VTTVKAIPHCNKTVDTS